MKSQITALLLLVSSFVFGSEISFPEHHVSVTLPDGWHVGGQEQVDRMNALLLSDPKTAKVQYYRMILSPVESNDQNTFHPYILLQIINRSVPPEAFISMFPEIEPRAKEMTENLRKELALDVKADKPYFDDNTATAVMPITGVNQQGQAFAGRSIFLPTKDRVIAFHLYADASNSAEIFSSILPALQAAQVGSENKVSDEWVNTAKRFITRMVTKRKAKSKE